MTGNAMLDYLFGEEPLPIRATLTRMGTGADACMCANCISAHACRDCDDWDREVKITVGRSPSSRWEYMTMVVVTEYHALNCPRAAVPDEGFSRMHLVPQQRAIGPRNRFDPIHPSVAPELDTSSWPDAHWLYRAFDVDGELLYVGITSGVAARMRAHRRKSRWWALCDYLELTVYRERFEARAAERRAIRTELPRFNDAD